MRRTWVVVVEAAGVDGSDLIDRGDVARLLEALAPGREGGMLHSPNRYALQVTTTGSDPGEALSDVLSRWTDAARRLGLPRWEVIRTEVLTPQELERDFQIYESGEAITSSSPIVDRSGDLLGRELLRRAFSDPLTDLLGEEAFIHRLEVALRHAGAQGAAAVVCLDLDAFGTLNDRRGWSAADSVLITVAQRLAGTVRPGDGVARLGNDEYAVLLEDAPEAAAVAIVERILDAVRLPLVIDGQELSVTASAGVALGEPGDDARVVAANAQAALAQAKEAGGDRHVLFDPRARKTHAAPWCRISGTGPPQDRLAHFLLLQEAAVAANESDTLDQAARVVMRQICAHVGCVIGHLWVSPADTAGVPSSSGWYVTDSADYRPFQEDSDKLWLMPGTSLPGRAWATGGPVWIADLAADPDWVRRESSLAAGLAAGFAVPVLIGPEVVAVLEFFSRSPLEPTGSFLEVLAGIGAQLGRVVERQRAIAALRRSEHELRVSEARLRQAQSMAHLGSWYFDLRTGESDWSDEMYALYGLDPDGRALDLDSALASVHPVDRAAAQAALSRLVETGQRIAEEVRVLRADGQLRWHLAEGMAIRDELGVVVGIHGTSQDITERRRVHAALRETGAQLREAQRVARIGSWERDLSTGRVTWSDGIYDLWGWEPGQEISFDAFLATVHPDDRPRLLELGAHVRETSEPTCVDFRAVVADGGQHWFRGRAQLRTDEHGTPIKLVGTAQDVTEEIRAAKDLRAVKELYERIVETSHEGIWTTDDQDVTTFVNPRMAQILGYSRNAMAGMRVMEFVDDATLPALAGHLRRRRAGLNENFATRLRAQDGSLVQVLMSASAFHDEDGTYVGALAMVTDVSALLEDEEVLRRQGRKEQACEDRRGPSVS